MKHYFIKENYNHRLNNSFFDDTPFKDEWQKEVYMYARKIAEENNLKSVLDIGTGSGYKLMSNFKDFNTLGMDLTPTVQWLKKTYSDRKWTDNFEPVLGYDIIIASDVIEHLPDPDTLLDLIQNCHPKMIVFSTPDRDLSDIPEDVNGPPENSSHVREWNMVEFKNYIESRFKVLEQFISNDYQRTQVVLATLK
jgi:2-polyprenyl-3-methyl-5-hydroxy-6-metoxy-1,4-benzoquinol methylase